MPKRSDVSGNDSTGKVPYSSRPRKKSSTARAKPSSHSLTKSVDELDPDRRSTAEERRRVIVEALRLSSRMAEDPELPPSARTAALVQIKVLSDQLMRIDESDPDTVADAWSGKRPRAV